MRARKEAAEVLPTLTFHQVSHDGQALPEWAEDLLASSSSQQQQRQLLEHKQQQHQQQQRQRQQQELLKQQQQQQQQQQQEEGEEGEIEVPSLFFSSTVSPAPPESESSYVERLACEIEKHGVLRSELERRTLVHSPKLAELWAKLGLADGQVVERVLAECRRLEVASVCSADDLRRSEDGWVEEQARLERAVKDSDLALAVARATNRRERASEKSLTQANAELTAEVARMRELIGRFIDGDSQHDPHAEEAYQEERLKLETEVDANGEAFSEKQILILARERATSLFEMDGEIDAIFAMVATESDRQSRLVRDVETMVHRCDPIQFGSTTVKKTLKEVACQHEAPRVAVKRGDNRAPPPFPEEEEEKGTHIPVPMRHQMTSFPKIKRIPSLPATLKLITSIYLEKLRYDRHCVEKHQKPGPFAAFPHRYLLKKFGLVALSDEQASQLVLAVEYHAATHRRVRLFRDWIIGGAMSLREAETVFGLLAALKRLHVDVAGDLRSQVSVPRPKAESAFHAVFAKKHLPEALDAEARILLSNLQENTQNKSVDLDDLMELCDWTLKEVDKKWRTHLSFLFKRHRVLYTVQEELRFAEDTDASGSSEAHDALLVEVAHRAKILYCKIRSPRRYPLANKQDDAPRRRRSSAVEEEDEGSESSSSSESSSKAPLEFAALLSFDAFDGVLREVNPYIKEDEVRRIFAVGIAKQWRKIRGEFDEVWARYRMDYSHDGEARPVRERGRRDADGTTVNDDDEEHGKRFKKGHHHHHHHHHHHQTAQEVFYASALYGRAQWAKPYSMANFTVEEIDEDVFIDLCLDEELLAKSPLAPVLDRDPDEIWPNAESLLAQIKIASRSLDTSQHTTSSS